MVMPKIKRRWGRLWLNTTYPYTLCIEATPGRVSGYDLANFKDEEHKRRWIELAVAPTTGVTAQNLEYLEMAISDLTAAGVIKH